MKMEIVKSFKGHSSLNQQSSLWVRVEYLDLDEFIKLYCDLQRDCKIIVSNHYEILESNLISIS